MEEEKPVHASYDISSGEYTEVEVSDEEHQAMKDREAANTVERLQREQEDAELRAAVENHTDPVVKALARRAGLI